jgi:hypothetical protein
MISVRPAEPGEMLFPDWSVKAEPGAGPFLTSAWG